MKMFSPDLLWFFATYKRQDDHWRARGRARDIGNLERCRIGKDKYARETGFTCQCCVKVGAVCVILDQVCCGQISEINFGCILLLCFRSLPFPSVAFSAPNPVEQTRGVGERLDLVTLHLVLAAQLRARTAGSLHLWPRPLALPFVISRAPSCRCPRPAKKSDARILIPLVSLEH